MDNMIQTNQLTKRYTVKPVINQVSMNIKEGEIYGFLGPNGAGKTTLMKMILNLVKPTSGEIFIQNQPIMTSSYKYLKDIGSLIEYPIFYEELTAQENLQMHCAYMGYKDQNHIKKVLDIVGLQQIEKKKVKEFSLGMRQRLAIGRAIVAKPKILILDEPINGLDPIGIKEVRELLVMLKQQYGMTILISSHIVSEIESIADTIGVLNEGELIEEISMHSLRDKQQSMIEMVVSDTKKAKQLLEEKFNAKVQITNTRTLNIQQIQEKPSTLTKHLIMHGIDVDEVETVHQSLEEYFVNRINGRKQHA
ncbi:bacitracin ABC transporter ATP-binding protein [Siminovitchia terrae]|uniref:Bacitracin ABC transporter ATP-binding protein n=1 Tax=Siminovitchia terrae TaxID=1914933 RepID=A0ABQ4L219_SIMTE|nr:ABC transporter ATP-binding protein [Siminovitchia terrae]GIN94081.1 bacitracin ABC transporter ATP-binding protein [Siminovitchia terrae]GIN98320.1 bacitracin ABC transporter ATP-binding protein [Siminovitchia terrae]